MRSTCSYIENFLDWLLPRQWGGVHPTPGSSFRFWVSADLPGVLVLDVLLQEVHYLPRYAFLFSRMQDYRMTRELGCTTVRLAAAAQAGWCTPDTLSAESRLLENSREAPSTQVTRGFKLLQRKSLEDS